MENFIIYLIKVNIIISVAFIFYLIFLRKEKFLNVNRFILLGILISSFLIPLLPPFNFFHIQQIQNQNFLIKPLAQFYTSISRSVNPDPAFQNEFTINRHNR